MSPNHTKPKIKVDNEILKGPIPCSYLLAALSNEAHVWLTFPDRHSDPKLLAWYQRILSTEERERQMRFHFARDQRLYLLTHGILRIILSRYLKMAPDKWLFTRNRHGRPELVLPEGTPRLRFSVSRSDGLLACLIVTSIDAGIDVERIRKMDKLRAFSEYVHLSLETSRLFKAHPSDYVEGFFTFWTLKEAYVKAKGTGLSLPLDRSAFYFDASGKICLFTDLPLENAPSNWQFESFRPTRAHSLAVALRLRDRAHLRIRLLEAVPWSRKPVAWTY